MMVSFQLEEQLIEHVDKVINNILLYRSLREVAEGFDINQGICENIQQSMLDSENVNYIFGLHSSIQDGVWAVVQKHPDQFEQNYFFPIRDPYEVLSSEQYYKSEKNKYLPGADNSRLLLCFLLKQHLEELLKDNKERYNKWAIATGRSTV